MKVRKPTLKISTELKIDGVVGKIKFVASQISTGKMFYEIHAIDKAGNDSEFASSSSWANLLSCFTLEMLEAQLNYVNDFAN